MQQVVVGAKQDQVSSRKFRVVVGGWGLVEPLYTRYVESYFGEVVVFFAGNGWGFIGVWVLLFMFIVG